MADLVLNRGIGHGRCRSCKKPVVFAETAATSKLAPFEADPAGQFVFENGVAKHVGPPVKVEPQLGLALDGKPPAPEVPEPQRYTSHFSTCPNARNWRK